MEHHSLRLPVESQQWKRQNNVWELKVNNRHQQDVSDAFIVNFEHILHIDSVSSADFEQVNARWDIIIITAHQN